MSGAVPRNRRRKSMGGQTESYLPLHGLMQGLQAHSRDLGVSSLHQPHSLFPLMGAGKLWL